MLNISQRFAAALNLSGKRKYTATVTLPGGEPLPISLLPGATVTSSSGIGVRRQASAKIEPIAGVSLYEIVSTPGAIFDIRYGIDFGGGDLELLRIFYGEAASGGVDIIDGDIDLTLVDLWQRLDRCRFSAPVSVNTGYRPIIIGNAISGAIPGITIDQRCDNGSLLTKGGTWDTARTDLIKDLATDGSLDVYMGPDGSAVIQDEPIINQTAPVWTYRTGVVANLLAASRTKPFDKLYNEVVVHPVDETQTWPAQTVALADPTNPRHWTRIGHVPFFYSSPTITNVAEARTAGNTILQRLQGTSETFTIQALGNPAQEVGDTVTIIKPSTDTDSGVQAPALVDSWTLRLDSGDMDVATRSSSLAEVVES